MSLARRLKAQGGKVYNNAKKDLMATRRRFAYEPSTSPKRLEFREEIDRLERRRAREKVAEIQRAIEEAHLECRESTRLKGKPPRTLIVRSGGEIFVSRDPQPLKLIASKRTKMKNRTP